MTGYLYESFGTSGSRHVPCLRLNGVTRMAWERNEPPQVFAGEMSEKMGTDNAHFRAVVGGL